MISFPPGPVQCPYGSVVKDGVTQTAVWLTLDLLPVDLVTQILLKRPSARQAFASAAVALTELCQQNPAPPPAFTLADFAGTAVDFVAPGTISPDPFLAKLWQYVTYYAWVTFCQCVPPPPVGTGCAVGPDPTTVTWSTAAPLHLAPFYGTVSQCGDLNGNCYPIVSVNVHWDSAIAPNVPGGVPVSFALREGSVDRLHCGLSSILSAGTSIGPFDAFWQIPFDAEPTTTLDISLYEPSWTNGQIILSGMTLCDAKITGICPPPPTDWTDIPNPPATAPCSVEDLCNLLNSFLHQLVGITNNSTTVVNTTTNTNTQVTDITVGNTTVYSQNPEYREGASWTVTDQGEQAIAQGTRALSVSLLEWPPPLDPRPSSPLEFWNVGWVRTGNDVGWDRKAWLRTQAQRVVPSWPAFNRFSWTLAAGVTIQVTELL